MSTIKIKLEIASAALCFSFGLLMLVFVISPGDGGWILYGQEILSGRGLYTDLHLNQQPIFPLISAAIAFSTDSILYQRILYIPVLAILCYALYKMSTVVKGSAFNKALLICAVFFVAIRFEAYRFDDYHPLAHALVLLSAAISYEAILYKKWKLQSFFFVQGAIFCFVLLVRVNEGLVVLVGSASSGILVAQSLKNYMKGAVFFVISFVSVLCLTLLLIGESPYAWFDYSFLRAVGNKGGGSVFRYPFDLLLNSASAIRDVITGVPAKLALILLAGVGFLTSLCCITKKLRFIKCFCVAAILILLEYYFYLIKHSFVLFLIPILILASVLATNHFLVGFLLRRNLFFLKMLVIMSYPVTLFLFGSLSSGGRYQDLTFPAAFFLFVIAILANNFKVITDKFNVYIVFSCVLLMVLIAEGVYKRSNVPYSWHTYIVPRFFSSDFSIERDTSGSPLILSKQVKALIEPVCKIVTKEDTLLSLPFSFANYYCMVPVWHGYVQSFFDTSGPDLIYNIVNDLKDNPPSFIFYQRQLENLAMHELLFNKGDPLAHRQLDDFIMAKLDSKEWSIVYRSSLFPPSDWILIKTSK